MEIFAWITVSYITIETNYIYIYIYIYFKFTGIELLYEQNHTWILKFEMGIILLIELVSISSPTEETRVQKG